MIRYDYSSELKKDLIDYIWAKMRGFTNWRSRSQLRKMIEKRIDELINELLEKRLIELIFLEPLENDE